MIFNGCHRNHFVFSDNGKIALFTLHIHTLTPRKSVAYAWNSSYDACIYIKIIKHVKICYYIYCKHDISRKSAVQLLLFFVVKRRKITMQWFHVKTFKFVCYCFYCLTSIFFFFLFCFCETNFDVFTIFSELSGLEEM